MSDQKATRYEFGHFTVVVSDRALLKTGEPVPLTPKEFETLHVLLRGAGRLVTKEDIIKQVWPDTFVSDGSLARNISVLRKALGDGYIQTVSRAGYRFVGAVKVPDEVVAPSGNDNGSDARSASAMLARAYSSDSKMRIDTLSLNPPIGRRTVPWKIIASIAALLSLALATWFYVHRPRRITEIDTIVIADFTNTTGDPVFDGTLRQGLSVQLEQSPFLSIISDQQVQQTLQMMGQRPDAKLTPEIARELCQRTGGTAVLNGSITQVGTPYLLTLKAVDCLSGESLASTEVQASDKNHVLDALGKTASEIRSKLGESLSTVRKFNTPLEHATTRSLEALQSYTLAWKSAHRGELAAVTFFERAIRIDSNFAMAYASLGSCYGNHGEEGLAVDNTRKAYELREGVSDREKFYIEAHYYDTVSGNLEKARQVYELWAQTYPRDSAPVDNLAGIYWALGNYDKRLAENREFMRLEPTRAFAYEYLVNSYLALNRLEEAQAAAEQAHTKQLDTLYWLQIDQYRLAFLKNDAAVMAKEVAWAEDNPEGQDVFLANEANTAAYYGMLGKARNLSRRAVALAHQVGKHETAANYEVDAALREAVFGNAGKAREYAAAGFGPFSGWSVKYGAALALALAGDLPHARAIGDAMAKRFPEGTVAQLNYLPTLHAQLALNRHDAVKAIEDLQVTASNELGGTWRFCYPVFVRGEAYLAAHRGAEASAEFQKILDHRGIVVNEPIGALAHLEIGRGYAMQGDTAKARAAYQDFLTLWKDADPDIPILKQAKAEYAKLQ